LLSYEYCTCSGLFASRAPKYEPPWSMYRSNSCRCGDAHGVAPVSLRSLPVRRRCAKSFDADVC
jgi:hypothetical protein